MEVSSGCSRDVGSTENVSVSSLSDRLKAALPYAASAVAMGLIAGNLNLGYPRTLICLAGSAAFVIGLNLLEESNREEPEANPSANSTSTDSIPKERTV